MTASHSDPPPAAGDPADDDPEAVYERSTAGRDPVTRREAFEQEMADQGRSDEAGDVGEHIE